MNNVDEEDEIKCLYKSKYLEHVEIKKETLTYYKIQNHNKDEYKNSVEYKTMKYFCCFHYRNGHKSNKS